MNRHSGVFMPLFSAHSTGSWGIGELSSVAPLSTWVASAGADRLVLLPIGTMSAGESSPYSAASAMAIDPIYIDVGLVPDFSAAGGLASLSSDGRAHLEQARTATRIQYASVRSVKEEALDLAFAQFVREEWEAHTPRAAALAAYLSRERWWLDDYALFQTLTRMYPLVSWRDWPESLRDRDPQALDAVRHEHAQALLRQQYLQWIAEEQWQTSRSAAEACGVSVFGDLPFVVNLHSADVWARADEFLLDVSVGVPPDAFSTTGQNWGLPGYRWDLIAARDFSWIRQRARRVAALFTGFRIDHLVGLYRTYGYPHEGEPFFMPADEPSQLEQGEAVVRIFAETGASLIAEDLGTIPDFVRASLARLGVPGCKVLRWERQWREPGCSFIDPVDYPPVSCALTGTHDTEPLAEWWDKADFDERSAVLCLPLMAGRHFDPAHGWSSELRDALVELACTAASRELVVAVPDLFGWRDRVNVPGTVGDHNWTWRLPWPVDQLIEMPDAIERAAFFRACNLAHRRGQA